MAPQTDVVDSVLAFLPVVVVLVLSPGVNNLVVLQGTLAAGPRGGVVATAGTSLGILVWAGAAAVGLAGAVRSSPDVWTAVQWVGALVLLVLGGRSLVRAVRSDAQPHSQAASTGSAARGFLRALATSVLNPRAGVVALALLPQFVATGSAPAVTTLVLGVTWSVVAGAWNLVGVWLVTRGRVLLSHPLGRRAVDALGGLSMVAVAASVALPA